MDDPLPVRRGEGPTDLVQHPGGPFQLERAIIKLLCEVPSAQESHHEVRAAGFAPVVVERNHVRML
jgi:hypothetical protein